MSTEKLTDRYDGEQRYGRTGAGMSLFIAFGGLRRLSGSVFLFFVCLSGLGAVYASEPVAADVSSRVNVQDFYDVSCHSHYYHLSFASFASIWMFLNAAVFVFAFCIFLKHWCFRAFTSDTAKGY